MRYNILIIAVMWLSTAIGQSEETTRQRGILSINNVSNTSDANKPVSTAQAAINSAKVNYTDTSNMLSAYRTAINGKASGTGSATNANTGDNAVNNLYSGLAASKVNVSDSAAMLSKYVRVNGSAATLTNFPTLNQNTSGTAAGLSANIAESQVTNLVSDLALKAPLANPPFTGTVTTTGSFGITAGAGSGGTVTQLTNRTTGVTINKISGAITTNNTSLAAGAEASFTVTNSTVAIGDVVLVTARSGQTAATSIPFVTTVANGSFVITLSNFNASTADTGAMVINFLILKSVSN